METLPCERCKGTTKIPAFIGDDGKVIIPEKACRTCEGRGYFVEPDVAGILKACQGRKPRTLCSKRPKDSRAYYVWRMARFHGGKDVTMPVMAGLEVFGDPYAKQLDELADVLAHQVFGSNMRAALAWGRVLGKI